MFDCAVYDYCYSVDSAANVNCHCSGCFGCCDATTVAIITAIDYAAIMQLDCSVISNSRRTNPSLSKQLTLDTHKCASGCIVT